MTIYWIWLQLLAYATGLIEQSMLNKMEYLLAENRIYKKHQKNRLLLTNAERKTLAEKGKLLGKELSTCITIVRPETLLKWYRSLIAAKWNYSQKARHIPGRPAITEELEKQIVQLARENPTWGYDRIVGALRNLGFSVSDATVANVLKKHGIEPVSERKRDTTWSQFIKGHLDVMWATDFFTEEILTPFGLTTFYVLFFIHLQSRRIVIGGVTANPNAQWCEQIARNVTGFDGELARAKYLIHDRDSKYTEKFDAIFKSVGCKPVKLPPRSPNLNAYAERWVRSVKEECLGRYILFSQKMLRHVLKQYVIHYHAERNHQGVNNELLFPDERNSSSGRITRQSRLGGLLNFYFRKAA